MFKRIFFIYYCDSYTRIKQENPRWSFELSECRQFTRIITLILKLRGKQMNMFAEVIKQSGDMLCHKVYGHNGNISDNIRFQSLYNDY